MGVRFEYTCPECRYVAHVSGGPDRGATHHTLTIACGVCQELQDVAVFNELAVSAFDIDSEVAALLYGMEACTGRMEPRCPMSTLGNVHPFTLWRGGGPCPRCGQTMIEGESLSFWD